MEPQKKRLEPWDELPEASLRKVREVADAIHKATDSIEYNLATDTIKVPGQNWACVSFVSPDGNQKCKSIGMKIRGVFDKQEEATDYVKRLIKLDPTFDIYVCEMYNWCLVPPDPEMITNQTYQDETLNSLISEYRKNQIHAKEHFEERKREMMAQAAEEARAAALKRIEEESQKQMEDATITPLPEDENRIIDITELSLNDQATGVSASEVMDSML
jgi:excinuclease UvrABC nuclease subunit